MRRILLNGRWSGFVGRVAHVVVKMKLVNLSKDERIFLLRLHLDDHGQHPQPHRWIRHKPDRRSDKNRDDRAREEASEADGIQRPMEYDLGCDGRRREESDQPEPLDPAIVDRRLSQVEQTVIPFDEPPHHGYEWHSVLSVLMLGGRVSTSDMQRGVALPCCGFGSGLANPELEAGPEEARHVIGLRLDSLPRSPRESLERFHVRQ